MESHVKGIQPFCCENPIELHHCDVCNFKTEQTVLFRRHLRERHVTKLAKEGRTYLCKSCDFRSHFLLDWWRHVVNCASRPETPKPKRRRRNKPKLRDDIWYECDQCEYTTMKRWSLGQHKISKHTNPDEINWFRCDQCEFKAKVRSNLTSHIKKIHLKVKCPERWFNCDRCKFKSKTKEKLRVHTLMKHLSDEEIKWVFCTQCEFKSKTKDGLQLHIKRKHRTDGEIRWFKCEHCEYQTKLKTDLAFHVNRVHVETSEIRWWPCDMCKYKAKIKRDLRRHRVRMMHFNE